MFALFGLYVWEIFQTSGFEWSLITRTRKFTWPLVSDVGLCKLPPRAHDDMYRVSRSAGEESFLLTSAINLVFFFQCRYCLLLALIGMYVSQHFVCPCESLT